MTDFDGDDRFKELESVAEIIFSLKEGTLSGYHYDDWIVHIEVAVKAKMLALGLL